MFKKVTDIIEWLVVFLGQWRAGQLTVADSLGDLQAAFLTTKSLKYLLPC